MLRKARPQPLAPRLTAEEEAAHAAFIAGLGTEAVWLDYGEAAVPAGRAASPAA
jgi:DNA polymerase-3 subunit epsilon